MEVGQHLFLGEEQSTKQGGASQVSNYPPAVLASRIHQPGCPWVWTSECTEGLAATRFVDEEAVEILIAKANRAHRLGLPPVENSNRDDRRQVTHRCPVGDQVLRREDHGFNKERPMPWTGELYAASEDERTLFRLYFAERRSTWTGPTTDIIGCGIGIKPVAEDTAWTSADQTSDIKDAMDSAVTYCVNTQRVWRRWNTA